MSFNVKVEIALRFMNPLAITLCGLYSSLAKVQKGDALMIVGDMGNHGLQPFDPDNETTTHVSPVPNETNCVVTT